MSAKAQDYHKRLTAFMTDFVFPAEEAYDRYRQEAGPDDHTVPPVIEELKGLAKERGLWNLFLPAVSGLTNLEYAPLAELTGLEPGDRTRGHQLRRTGHRQHGDLAPVRHRSPAQAVAGAAAGWRDPQRVLDDRAGGGLQRRPQHRNADHPRRRRLRDQRPQVVDDRGVRSALQGPDRDGPHQPRRGQSSAAVDGAGAHRYTRGRTSFAPRPCSAGRTSTGTARSSTTTCGCPWRTCSARRARGSRSPRRGSARAASTTACARWARPSGRWR